jgi:hypothetical protein
MYVRAQETKGCNHTSHHTTFLYITNALVVLPLDKWVITNLPGVFGASLLVSRHTDAVVVGMVWIQNFHFLKFHFSHPGNTDKLSSNQQSVLRSTPVKGNTIALSHHSFEQCKSILRSFFPRFWLPWVGSLTYTCYTLNIDCVSFLFVYVQICYCIKMVLVVIEFNHFVTL